jgi:sugar lactone lactonase YvrE
MAGAISAVLSYPSGVAVDGADDVYIADTNVSRVRKVSPAGLIATVAGNGRQVPDGDGIPATSAGLVAVQAIALDNYGNLFVANGGFGRVQRISPEGIVTTVAGRANAQIGCVWSLAVDNAGTLYIGDITRNVVWKVSRSGATTVVAGNGTAGFSGDDGPATSAQLNAPVGLAVDVSGNLYIADAFNHRIRMVSTDGIITTAAGNGILAYSGDGGPATKAQFGLLSALTIDRPVIYTADQYYNVIRVLRPVGSQPGL